jgi:hypothetical protein
VARVVHGPPPGAPTQAPDSRAISGVRQRRKGHPEGKTCPDAGLPGFRHHFSHAWPDRRGAAGDLTGLNGWTSPQMLRRYGASARSARARRSYARVMDETP